MPADQVRIIIYAAVDPTVPANLRFVAHWTRRGRASLEVATQPGPTDACGAQLVAFLTTEIDRNTKPAAKAGPPSERSAEMRRRSLLAAEARRARRSEP